MASAFAPYGCMPASIVCVICTVNGSEWCAEVPLRNCSLAHSLANVQVFPGQVVLHHLWSCADNFWFRLAGLFFQRLFHVRQGSSKDSKGASLGMAEALIFTGQMPFLYCAEN